MWNDLSTVILNVVVTVVAVTVAAVIGMWVQDRGPPTIIRSVEAQPSTVAPGGVLRMRYHLTRKRSCRVHVEQIIYDSAHTRFVVGNEDHLTAPGWVGEDHFALQFTVPEDATEGAAYYRGIRTYYCNPVHFWFAWPVIVYTADVPFMIEKPAR